MMRPSDWYLPGEKITDKLMELMERHHLASASENPDILMALARDPVWEIQRAALRNPNAPQIVKAIYRRISGFFDDTPNRGRVFTEELNSLEAALAPLTDEQRRVAVELVEEGWLGTWDELVAVATA